MYLGDLGIKFRYVVVSVGFIKYLKKKERHCLVYRQLHITRQMNMKFLANTHT